jgi:hypothetical protein
MKIIIGTKTIAMRYVIGAIQYLFGLLENKENPNLITRVELEDKDYLKEKSINKSRLEKYMDVLFITKCLTLEDENVKGEYRVNLYKIANIIIQAFQFNQKRTVFLILPGLDTLTQSDSTSKEIRDFFKAYSEMDISSYYFKRFVNQEGELIGNKNDMF